MGELAARTIFSNDTGPLAGTGLDTLAKNQAAILELEGAQAPQSKTITDGSISPTAAYVIVDTEGSAAADDLSVINPVLSISENLHDGMIVYLRAADSGRVVTVKNTSSANGINTYDGNDYVLSSTHWLKLQLRSGKWYEVEGREMVVALAAATAAAAASTPATTTARGIGRVATLADMEPDAEVGNGPAFLEAGSDAVTPTPTPNTIMCRDEAGRVRVEDPVHDKDVANKTYVDNSLIWDVTGSITLNGTTDNTVVMTDIVPELALEIGDVIRIETGAYNKLHTVESITDNSSIIVNYEHAGNRVDGSLKLPDFTGQATVTRIAKWHGASVELGRAWVNFAGTVTRQNTTGRGIQINGSYGTSNPAQLEISNDGVTFRRMCRSINENYWSTSFILPDGWYMKSTTTNPFQELR